MTLSQNRIGQFAYRLAARGKPARQGHGGANAVSGSSFYLALRILPVDERKAMFAIYDYCRALDDIADNTSKRSEKAGALATWRTAIEMMFSGRSLPGLEVLSEAVKSYDLQQQDFMDVIDGMMMDVREEMRGPSWPVLDLYCDRVASAVGRLSVRIFGLDTANGTRLARHLGLALQLTNILRDIDEDAELGRLYLPREALAQAGVNNDIPEQVVQNPRLDLACECVASRAQAEFDEADWIMAACPRNTVRAPRLMSVAYRAILERMAQQGWAAPRKRVSVNKLGLLAPAILYGLL